jgi:hypothetical protein
MKKLVKTGVAILLAVMVLVLGSCPNGTEETVLSSDAVLASITVAGKTVNLGTPKMDWAEAAAEEHRGEVFLSASQMSSAEVTAVKGQNGQTIFLAAAKPSVMPDFVTDTTFSFETYDFLWVEVFSENHDAYNIYAIEIKKTTPTVLDLTLGGRSASGGKEFNGRPIQQYGTGLGSYSADLTDFNNPLAGVTAGEVWFGSDQIGASLAIVVTPEDPDTEVLVAKGGADAAADALFPAGYATPSQIQATEGDYLYLKAVSADEEESETIYYKVKLVSKQVSFTIGDVTMIAQGGGSAVTFGIGAAGTQGFGGGENRAGAANLAADGSSYKNILSSSGTMTVTVNIGSYPPTAKLRYGRTDWDAAQENVPSTGHVTLVYQDNKVISGVETNDYIAIEVTNELGDKRWYAFRVRNGNPEAALTALTISTGEVVSPAPGANASVTGTTSVTHTMSDEGPWTTAINATTSSGSTKAYAVANTASENITTWADSGVLNVSTSQYVVVRVTPQDGGPASFYKVRLIWGDETAELDTATVGGVLVSGMTPGTLTLGNAAYVDKAGNIDEVPIDFTGNIGDVTLPNGNPTTVVAASSSTGATIRYGYIHDEKEVVNIWFQWGYGPDLGSAYTINTRRIIWNTTGEIPSPIESLPGGPPEAAIDGLGNYIIIEITSQNKVTVNTYVIKADL